MYTKTVTKIIQEKLKAKENALSWRINNFGDYDEGTVKPKDINSRTTFVRMCSNKLSVPNIVISGGELDEDASQKFGLEKNVLNQFFGLYQNQKDDSGKEYGARPIAGIKNIEVNYKGSFKAIREATVNWVVSSVADLERMTPYFLTVGKTIALDWGWVNPNVKTYHEMFNGQDPFITFRDGQFEVDQNIFTNPQYKIQSAGGDYDALAGKISNFEMTLRQDGGFDCITKVTAIGAALFQKPIDKPSNQIQYEPKKDDNEDGEKEKVAYDSNNIINAIINLRSIILSKKFGVDTNKVVTKNSGRMFDQRKSLTENPIPNKTLHADRDHGIAVDNINNPQVLWTVRKTNNPDSKALVAGDSKILKEDIFVKWGWMEDQLLNRYVALKGGGGDGAGVKMTIRSIDTVLDDNNLPIKLTEDKAEELNVDYGDVSYDAGTGFYEGDSLSVPETNSYQVKAGDSLSKIADKLGVDINQLVQTNLNKLLPMDSAGDEDTEIYAYGPEDSVGVPEDFDPNNPSGIVVGNQFISSQNYGDLNLQPGQVLLFTPIKAVVEGDAEKSIVIGNVEIEDEKTQFRGLGKIANKGNFLKTPTVIKNVKKFLKPIKPFSFFSTELLPTLEEIYGNRDYRATKPSQSPFIPFYNKLTSMKDNQFTKPGDNGLGRLRYMWVNIKEIQKAFGITIEPDGSTPTNVSPPGTLEKGLKNLLSQLNRNFYDFWEFELTVDPYDSTNIKVMDKKVTDLSGASLNYTKFNPNGYQVIGKEGIYKFPAFKVGSMVKNQNLSFKIPDSMAITILYGSNKEEKENESSNAFNNPDIMKIFGGDKRKTNDNKDVWSDKFLADANTPAVSKDESGKVFTSVGSQDSNHNSKISQGYGIDIQSEDIKKEWIADNKVEDKNPDLNQKVKQRFQIINDNIVFQQETFKLEGGSKGTYNNSQGSYINAKAATKVIDVGNFETVSWSEAVSLYKKDVFVQGLGLELKPEVQRVIRNRLTGGVKIGKGEIKELKVDSLIPAELTLEIDGIGGMVPGDVVQTEYIQPKYNINFYKDEVDYGPFTYFQVVGLSQKVDAGGWTTELRTLMRINHIPDIQDIKVGDQPGESKVQKDYIPPEPSRPSIPVPTDDEDIADDVTLDDLDFDDFEDWQEPLPPPPTVSQGVVDILNKGKVNIATKSQTFGLGSTGTLEEFIATENLRKNTSNQILMPKMSKRDNVSYGRNFIQEGSTYSNLQLGNQGFKLNIEAYEQAPRRPRIPVPTDDEDIADDVTLDVLEFDEFDPWEAPPKPITMKKLPEESVEDRIKQTEIKNPIQTKKELVFVKRESTYKGSYWQNDKYLYVSPHHPEWRPIFQFKDGSRRSFDTIAETGERAVKTIRAAREYSERRRYWDANIESPKPEGKSLLNKRGGTSTERDFYGPFNTPY